MAKVCAIVAMDDDRVIGHEGRLPWSVPEDLKRFSNLTTGHVVLMGRKTYESLPDRYRPLPGRENVVASRTMSQACLKPEVRLVASPRDYIESFKDPKRTLWIIGGAEIFRQTMDLWHELYLTIVHGKHTGDTYLPQFEKYFRETEREDNPGYSFVRYVRS